MSTQIALSVSNEPTNRMIAGCPVIVSRMRISRRTFSAYDCASTTARSCIFTATSGQSDCFRPRRMSLAYRTLEKVPTASSCPKATE